MLIENVSPSTFAKMKCINDYIVGLAINEDSTFDILLDTEYDWWLQYNPKQNIVTIARITDFGGAETISISRDEYKRIVIR